MASAKSSTTLHPVGLPTLQDLPPDESDENNPYFLEKAKIRGKLPPLLDHFNQKDLKDLCKCSVAVWISTLFILINPTFRALGQATFLGCLVLFIVPPSGVVLVQLLAVITILLGFALAWAWGVITMKAALSTRPAAELNARLGELQKSISQNARNATQTSGHVSPAKIAIYQGFMLDTRVSVTYFCMICLFIYFMARLRVKAPKLTLVTMFAMIVSDVFLTIGPLLPSFSGTIPLQLIKPAAVAGGLGFVCNILIFPRSTSNLVLDEMVGTIKPMTGFLEALLAHFHDPSKQMQIPHLKEVKMQTIEAYKRLESGLAFLPLDVAVSSWSPEDVASLKDPMRGTLTSFISLLQSQISWEQSRLNSESLFKMADPIHLEQEKKSFSELLGHNQIRRALDFRARAQHPMFQQSVAQGFYALHISSKNLIKTCTECLATLDESFGQRKNRSLFKKTSPEQLNQLKSKHSDTLTQLKNHKKEFVDLTAEYLLGPKDEYFDQNGRLKTHLVDDSQPPILLSLMLGLTLQDKILSFAQSLELLLSHMVSIEETRTKSRLWLPKGVQKLFNWATSDENAVPGALSRTVTSDQQKSKRSSWKDKRAKRSQKVDESKVDDSARAQLVAIQQYSSRQRSKIGMLLLGTVDWLTNTEGLFALRVIVVTIAVAIPAVIPSSAGFFYRERGLWAVIMAQTSLVTYTADFVFGFGLRLIGTILGGVVGMVLWYIGAGNGPGNSYGLAAATGVAIVVFMWLRLFAHPSFLQGVILSVATLYLVIGYSWADTHLPSYGNPGVGYTVFWRRMLLVIIGVVAGAIVTFLPSPPSGNKHYRQLMSNSIQSVKDRYALLATNCQNSPLPPDLREVSEKLAIDEVETLLSIEGPIKLVRFEFSSSPFDSEVLGSICQLCMDMNMSITQLLRSATALPPQHKARFVLTSGVLEEQLFADVMAVLALLQQTLKTGEPLPAILPVPLQARSMDMARLRLGGDVAERETALTKQEILDPGFRQYCDAMGAFITLIGSVDELVLAVKRAVGEAGNVMLRNEF